MRVVVVSKNYDTLIRKWFINDKSRRETTTYEVN
jgi:hypothetical protein